MNTPANATPQDEVDRLIEQFDPESNFRRLVGVSAGIVGVLAVGLSGWHYYTAGFGLHNEIVAPYILSYGTDAQKAKFLPAMARGEVVGAIAMSEPAAGSDLQGIRSTATDAGDHFLLNGSKTFITNGWHADVVIVVAKTDPAAGAKGTSLLLVERGMAGFEKGKRLKKVGMKGQDTSELFFDNVKVPKANLLGDVNRGFVYLMQELPWERLQIAIDFNSDNCASQRCHQFGQRADARTNLQDHVVLLDFSAFDQDIQQV